MIRTKHVIEFSPEKCVGCGLCYKACFVDVIRWDAQAKRPLFKYVKDCEHCFYCHCGSVLDGFWHLPFDVLEQ